MIKMTAVIAVLCFSLGCSTAIEDEFSEVLREKANVRKCIEACDRADGEMVFFTAAYVNYHQVTCTCTIKKEAL
mgnify:CR=1 FL=1